MGRRFAPESAGFNQSWSRGVWQAKENTHLRGEPNGADELLWIAYKPHLLPVLNQKVGERYALPASSPATITYTGLPLDAIEDALQRSVAMQNARGIDQLGPEDIRKYQAMPFTQLKFSPNTVILRLAAADQVKNHRSSRH